MAKVQEEKLPFNEFLLKKRINAALFQQSRAAEYQQWEQEYQTLSMASFDQQKKFYFNPLRLEFPALD